MEYRPAALVRLLRERLESVPGGSALFTTPLGMRIDEGLAGTPADLYVRVFGDYRLQPFATDSEGLATITREQLEAEVATNHDSGLMDHAHISRCSPVVEIGLLTDEEIRRAIDARKIWTSLLAGERDRWESLEQLLTLYRNANNSGLLAPEPAMRLVWNGRGTEYSYLFLVVAR